MPNGPAPAADPGLPAPIFHEAPFVADHGLRFHYVRSHSRLPDIRPRDYVLIRPIAAFCGDGEYIDENNNIWICDPWGGRPGDCRITCRTTGFHPRTQTLTLAEFADQFTGKVVGIMKMIDVLYPDAPQKAQTVRTSPGVRRG